MQCTPHPFTFFRRLGDILKCAAEEEMLRKTVRYLNKQNSFLENQPNFVRANKRKLDLERRRLHDSMTYVPPVEPTTDMARGLYRRMLKEGYRTLVCTDKAVYREKLRREFEVTARQTSGRVRGVMYEKGEWMLKNKLGGLV